jgi:hypothetical protein
LFAFVRSAGYLILFLWDRGLNSGRHACKAGAVSLQSILLWQVARLTGTSPQHNCLFLRKPINYNKKQKESFLIFPLIGFVFNAVSEILRDF